MTSAHPNQAISEPTIGLKQAAPVQTNNGSTSRVTTSGAVVQSSDPAVSPNAGTSQKLKGNVVGAVSGTVGSLQAATGAAVRNEKMEHEGLEKMQHEDERLGAKRGVMPIGSATREKKESVE